MTFSNTNTTHDNSPPYFFYNRANFTFISTRNRDNGITLNNFIHAQYFQNSQNFRSQRDNFHKSLGTQFSSYWTKYPSTHRL